LQAIINTDKYPEVGRLAETEILSKLAWFDIDSQSRGNTPDSCHIPVIKTTRRNYN
jgi:hypothetical protein